MKKIIALCLASLMLLGLCACAPAEENPKQTAKDLNMETVYEKLEKAVELPEMLRLDESLMLDYCGIRAEDVKQAVVVICADSLRTDEIWLVEAKDEATAKAIAELANNRLENKGEESITYSPEQYAVVEKAKLLQTGNYIALLVSPDVAALETAFRQEAGM